MRGLARYVCLFCFASGLACDARLFTPQPSIPNPSASPFFQNLDFNVFLSAAAPQLPWDGPVSSGHSASTSSGEGNWRKDHRYLIHCSEENLDLLRQALRDEIRRRIELAGATVQEEPTSAAAGDTVELQYATGNYRGRVSVQFIPTANNGKLLGKDQLPQTHVLAVEIDERFSLESR